MSPHDLPGPATSPPRGRATVIPARILVADDDPRNLLALEEILQAPGYEIVTVRSGADALRQVLLEDYAVILLDVQMPGMDGYEVANLIRSRPRCSHVPIIFLTAFNKDDLHVFRGYTAGAVDYVFKPIEPIILQSKVGVFVELYRKTEEIRRQSEQERALLIENLRVRGEKLKAEQELRRRDEHQALVVGSLPIALYTAAADGGRRLRFTGDMVEITGYPAEDFVEPGFWASHIHPEDRDRVVAELRAREHSGAITLEYRWSMPDGSTRYIFDHCVLNAPAGGHRAEFFGMWLDVTERKEMELSLLHASKLEALGRLTGGIAHDFNNMLSVVIGSLDLLQRSLGDNDIARKRTRMALDGAQRCADLTARLLSFARRQPLRASTIDLTTFGAGLVELLQGTLGSQVQVELDMPDELWPVRTDQSQLESALVNLALNSRDAMPDGGRLTVELRNVTASADTLPPTLVGDFVALSVIDSGLGMTQEVLGRVFEPFFTTKEVGRGTGLGLSMAYGFAKQSGGDIEIRSAEGQGTTVRLFLPRAKDEDHAAPTVPAEAPLGRGEVVLAVEDEPDVRRVTMATLEMLGYSPLGAEDGQAALSLLASNPDVRLLFTDINMPGGLDGFDLARDVRNRWPDVKILLTSGYVEDDYAERDVEILLKPYRSAELARSLRTLLDEETETAEPRAARA